MALKHPWAFRTRFRRAVFGWRGSKLAIERIHEALAEIRAVARQDPASAAEGAVLFLEKLSPALNQVDSSTGALGNATYAAVQDLVPVIRSAPVDTAMRKKWLDRLFEAIQEDDPPYIESLGDHWGELCATPELASSWADRLLPTQRKRGTYAYFAGTTLCYSALFKAGRHDELLELLTMDPRPIWPYLAWGGRVLVARGQVDEAIAYVRERAGSTTSLETIARFAEDALLTAGRHAEAFDQYALLANQANSNLSTFRALAKKYPELAPENLLGHLIASTPGEPGKWFATAKTLKLFDRATALAWASPCDPKTLTRAARDHLVRQPDFAMQAALAALHWISTAHGHELTALDVVEAHRLATEAARSTQQIDRAQALIEQALAPDRPMSVWMRRSLGLPQANPSPQRQ
ncbi:MAG: hypothetical protein LKCHEGNO_01208 [Burkholderiaceae bacterium]|nr:hypothetical protein [Burkholderiaceae bacterium]